MEDTTEVRRDGVARRYKDWVVIVVCWWAMVCKLYGVRNKLGLVKEIPQRRRGHGVLRIGRQLS